MPSNNIWNGEDFRGDETHLLIKRKELSVMAVEKLDISNETADSNNSGHSNVFKRL